MIPAGVDAPQRSDLASMDFGPGGYLVSMGGTFHGEKIIQARLKEIDGKWVLQTSVDGGRWSDIRLDGEFAEYLSNPRGGEFWTSNLNSNEQTAFATGERIFLLKRRRPEVTEMPDGGTLSREPPGPAPGVAVWIQQE